MLLRKTLQLSNVQLKMDETTGRFSGYASVFGGVDSYGDTIAPGAFKKTLRAVKPKMFFNHEWRLPIGKWDVLQEDDKGLFVEGELTPGMQLSADVRAALQHGTLDGLSIGGFVKKDDYAETETGRLIRNWSVLAEISPVAFPADGAARINLASVKSADLSDAIIEIETIRDLERFLRDAGGLSKGDATALVSRVKAVLGIEGEPAAESAETKAMAELYRRLQALDHSIPA